jgi:mannosylglycerate hydrolase
MLIAVHVVAHTHWDREWYHPSAVFGLRLVRLVDGLLELLERRPDFSTFLLDGQAIVLEDYLAVRPEQEGRLRRLFAEGRLEAGPWYVLADELLVSAEALVRNLLEGARVVRRLGGRPMPVGYSPDAFGHPAGFPTILAGFGMEAAVVWRGLGDGAGPGSDLWHWRAPDGATVLLVHLSRPGYENGQSLPRRPAELRERWERLRAELAPRARSPHWLVLAGADHHAPQADLPEVLEELGRLVPDARFAVGTLENYAGAVVRWSRESGVELPTVAGELRAGHRHAWALQGTHGSRLYLKRANAAAQRLLERYAEPLAALEQRGGAAARRAELLAAWRSLLENHPHDSICGTSADPVHREMVTRFERCLAQGGEIVANALDAVVGRDAAAARIAGRGAWTPAVLVFNPAPVVRDAVVEAEIALFRADVSVGQQRVPPAPPRRPGVFHLAGPDGATVRVQHLGTRDGHDLVESPSRYPLAAAVEWRRVAIDARALPPLGVAPFAVLEGAGPRSDAARPGDVVAEAAALRNAHLAVRVEPSGSLEVTHLATGTTFRGLGALWDNGDAGDSYTYSAPRGDRVVRVPDAVAVRVVDPGPLRGTLEIVRRYAAVALETSTTVTLDAGAEAVELLIAGENRRPDHRLRVAFPLGERAARETADGHFGPVERPPGPRPGSPPGVEQPAPTAPMQRYVSIAGAGRGLTVLTDGLPEYELRADGTLLVTLLRAFGQLSREDMPERPGHAGWPTPTPEAQCPGPFRARLAVRPHARSDGPAAIERAAEAFHAPPLAAMRRALLALPAAVTGPALSGEGLAFSAMKPADRGRGVVLRCFNTLDGNVAGAWRVPWPVRTAHLARLDETPLAPLDVGSDGVVRFEARPRAVVTILLR